MCTMQKIHCLLLYHFGRKNKSLEREHSTLYCTTVLAVLVPQFVLLRLSLQSLTIRSHAASLAFPPVERELDCNKCAFLDKCKRVDARGALALVAIYQKESETNTEEEEL